MDQIPKPKPFTEEQFKLNTDRRIKGALGGFDRGEMVDLIQKDLRKIEESGTMDYNDALKFIKERTQELKEFLENNPGEEMPSLPGFEEEERVNFLDGGDTEYNSMVTKKYIELGGQEGTGMDIDKFAEEYFPKMADGGRINFDEGSPGKKGGNYNPSGKNQFNPPSKKEVIDILNDPKYSDYSKSDFYKGKIIGKKTLDKYEKLYPDEIVYPRYGKKKKKDPTQSQKDRRLRTIKTSSESVQAKIAAPRSSGLNLTHAGAKNSPVGLHNLIYAEGSKNRRMVKPFEDKIYAEMEKFYDVYNNPDTPPEFKKTAATEYLKNDRALRKKYPDYAKLKTRLSFKKTGLTPEGFMVKEKLPDPSLAISNEPGMNLKGETPSTDKGKEIIKRAAERFGKFAKPIGKVALRAVSPFVPVLGTAGMVMGGADVAKAADQGMRNEELGIAYLAGPEVAQNYKDLKSRVKGKADETETYVP
jgi:hypothetical protein